MADSNVPSLPTAGALTGAEVEYCVQGGADKQTTLLERAKYILGKFSTSILGTDWLDLIVTPKNGGTGVDNTGKTITLGGNFATNGAFDTVLDQQGNATITLPEFTSELPMMNEVEQRVATTGATLTTLKTIAASANKLLAVSGYVLARRTGGVSGTDQDGGMYKVEVVVKVVAGNAVIINPIVTTIGESQVGWGVSCAVSGGDLLIQVTGAAANNINWAWAPEKVILLT